MSNFGDYNNYGDSGDGGGGFMAGSSPGQSGGDKKGMLRNKSTMTPVTLKQLLTATLSHPGDQYYKVDGKELIFARIVARVIHVADDAAQCRFTLIDGTVDSGVEMTLYLTQTDPAVFAQRRAILPRNFAEVTVQCRAGNGTNQVTVLDIRPTEHANAVTHHILEVINTHLFNTRGPLPRGGGGGGSSSSGGTNLFSSSSSSSSMVNAALLGAGFGGAVAAVGAGASSGNDDEAFILELYQTNSIASEEGVSVREVAGIASRQGNRRHLNMEAISRITEKLMLDGHIYSTIDEQHFKTTS